MSPALELRDISFAYGPKAVLEHVILKVERGEMVGVVGPNGAGKTTLLSIAGGSLRPSSGIALLNGSVDASRAKALMRARTVASVPQNPSVPEGFSALDVVLMGRNPHLRFLQWEGRRDLEVAIASMEATDCAGLADRHIESLSGGERQRVFIARALAQAPALLLLDEPTTHLDLGYQVSTMDTIDSVRRTRGLAVLAAMHDVSLAAQYCDRIAVLARGRIRAIGAPHEVLQADLLSEVFGTPVTVVEHPLLKTPVALAGSGGAVRKE